MAHEVGKVMSTTLSNLRQYSVMGTHLRSSLNLHVKIEEKANFWAGLSAPCPGRIIRPKINGVSYIKCRRREMLGRIILPMPGPDYPPQVHTGPDYPPPLGPDNPPLVGDIYRAGSGRLRPLP